jgi:hypothetical protein
MHYPGIMRSCTLLWKDDHRGRNGSTKKGERKPQSAAEDCGGIIARSRADFARQDICEAEEKEVGEKEVGEEEVGEEELTWPWSAAAFFSP